MSDIGAAGTVRGITITGIDQVPVPAAFRAATLNTWLVPFVSPVTVAEVAVDAERSVVQGAVPVLLCWIT